MASVLLLLPDELLAEIDAIRGEPRLKWIREALCSKLTMARHQAVVEKAHAESAARNAKARAQADERSDSAALAHLERGAEPSPARTPASRFRTVTRQGTLPDGSTCAHPFRDDENRCRTCGNQR